MGMGPIYSQAHPAHLVNIGMFPSSATGTGKSEENESVTIPNYGVGVYNPTRAVNMANLFPILGNRQLQSLFGIQPELRVPTTQPPPVTGTSMGGKGGATTGASGGKGGAALNPNIARALQQRRMKLNQPTSPNFQRQPLVNIGNFMPVGSVPAMFGAGKFINPVLAQGLFETSKNIIPMPMAQAPSESTTQTTTSNM